MKINGNKMPERITLLGVGSACVRVFAKLSFAFFPSLYIL